MTIVRKVFKVHTLRQRHRSFSKTTRGHMFWKQLLGSIHFSTAKNRPPSPTGSKLWMIAYHTLHTSFVYTFSQKSDDEYFGQLCSDLFWSFNRLSNVKIFMKPPVSLFSNQTLFWASIVDLRNFANTCIVWSLYALNVIAQHDRKQSGY